MNDYPTIEYTDIPNIEVRRRSTYDAVVIRNAYGDIVAYDTGPTREQVAYADALAELREGPKVIWEREFKRLSEATG